MVFSTLSEARNVSFRSLIWIMSLAVTFGSGSLCVVRQASQVPRLLQDGVMFLLLVVHGYTDSRSHIPDTDTH